MIESVVGIEVVVDMRVEPENSSRNSVTELKTKDKI